MAPDKAISVPVDVAGVARRTNADHGRVETVGLEVHAGPGRDHALLGDWDGAIRQALRIGHEGSIAPLRGGFRSWSETDAPIESGGRMTVDQLASKLDRGGPAAPFVIDVRQLSEYESGHVPGSHHIAGGSLPDRLDELPRDRPLAAICASGYRASVAASLLRAAGFTDVSWVADGVPTWRRRKHPTEKGAPADATDGASPAGSEEAHPGHSHAAPISSDEATPARR
jgi:rhodanese-related sulfurtransferase